MRIENNQYQEVVEMLREQFAEVVLELACLKDDITNLSDDEYHLEHGNNFGAGEVVMAY